MQNFIFTLQYILWNTLPLCFSLKSFNYLLRAMQALI